MKFVIFSHENYWLPIVKDFKAQVIWADMTKEETEPKEAEEKTSDVPKRVPDEQWSAFFANELEKRRQLQYRGMITKYPAEEVIERLLSIPKDKRGEYKIIFDFNHGVKFGEELMRAGYSGVFAQQWAYDLERKRDKASELVAKHYKEVGRPIQQKFGTGSADKMIQFMEKQSDKVWVVKPNGIGLWVFCPQSEEPPIALEECRGHIEANKEAVNAIPMILEERIIGTEINIETFYFEGKPLYSAVDLENKFMHTEEVGHQSGCAFDLVFFVPLDCELRRMCNEPFDKLARKLNFTGLMDMNAIIAHRDGKPYFIEFCPNRFGYNATMTEIEAYGKGAEQYVTDLITGKFKPDYTKFGASIKLFNEDWREDFYDSIFNPDYEGNKVRITHKDKGLWMWDVYKDGSDLKMANYSNEVMVTTAASDTPEGAIEKAKLKAERLVDFDGKYFRGDVDEYDRSYNPVYRYKYLRDRKLLEEAVV